MTDKEFLALLDTLAEVPNEEELLKESYQRFRDSDYGDKDEVEEEEE